MGEVAVEADRRPERADDVEAGEQEQIDPVKGDAPEETHRREDPERRHDDGDERHELADPARPDAHRSHRNGADGGRCAAHAV